MKRVLSTSGSRTRTLGLAAGLGLLGACNGSTEDERDELDGGVPEGGAQESTNAGSGGHGLDWGLVGHSPDAAAGAAGAAGTVASNPQDAGTTDPAAFQEPGWERLAVPDCLRGLTIDASELRATVAELSGALPVMIAGQPVRIDERTSDEGRARARAYLRERYLALGYEVEEQRYDGGANLSAQRSGEDDAFFIVSAHLDAVAGAPGADDDASGVATGLAIAAALADCPLRHTLRFVAFDQEELGAIGSAVYADQVRTSELDLALGVLQFEMTGYDGNGDGAYLVVDCDRSESQFIRSAIVNAVGTLGLPLHFTRYCTGASDHQSFWDVSVPAAVMSQSFFRFDAPADGNPCYHSACDTADQLSYAYMANVTRASALAVAQLVVVP